MTLLARSLALTLRECGQVRDPIGVVWQLTRSRSGPWALLMRVRVRVRAPTDPGTPSPLPLLLPWPRRIPSGTTKLCTASAQPKA